MGVKSAQKMIFARNSQARARAPAGLKNPPQPIGGSSSMISNLLPTNVAFTSNKWRVTLVTLFACPAVHVGDLLFLRKRQISSRGVLLFN